MSAIKGWKRVALAYVVALAVSHLMMWILHSPVIQQEETSDQEVRLNVFDGDQTLADEHITIGYDDIYEGSEENPSVLLLLPGGPEGPEVFDEVIPELATHYRLLIPHLPGYEGKNEDLPSYSFNSSARYSQQFLERLDIPEANVVGFGLGGASAIHLAHDNPDQVSSLTLIGSIGVQELQLLGSYRLNHAVHGMQLAGVWLFYNAIPHFGLFEAFEIDVSYAKRHYESDQRPLRDYLEQYNKPMLILHGKDDPLVPLAAAQEHNRIVPHSVLKLYNGNHDLLQSHTDSVSADIHQFISEVQNGTAQTRDTASEERIAESRKSFSNVDFAKFEGVSLLIIMLIIILGTLVSEDLTAIGAGLLAARGLIGFWPATLACFLGIFIGDVGLYVAGRFLGRPALKKAPFKWIINEEDLQKSSKWFKAKGPTIIVATRFLPGSRLPTYFSAGVMQVGFWMFLFYFILSGIIWAPLLVGVTQLLGNELLHYFTLYQGYAIWVLAGGLALIFITVKLIIPAFSYKGRRLLVSRYYKLSRWQHWWPVFKYLPVALYILYLGIKNRSLTLFTATNPGIADGGLAGESKSKMLDLLEDSSQVAAYQKITYHTDFREMLHIADRFIREHQLSYPVVLKPDVGQQGRAVAIIEDRYALQDYLADASEDLIIQEYIGGVEVSILYYRMPGYETGNILSMAQKERPMVTGDGQKTLEELILSNPATTAFANELLEAQQDHLYDIPGEGEQRTLIERGSYARGAIFRDATDRLTPSLQTKINEVGGSGEGFYFGRFDIKVPNFEMLSQGEGLQIIEVNGVTSIPDVIYDDIYSYIDGQRELIKQWRLAFKIGAKNREMGAKVTPAAVLIRKIFKQLTKE